MSTRTKGPYPTQFHSTILLRALGEKGIKDLYEQYKAHYIVEVGGREPNEKHLRLASLAKKIGIKAAAIQAGIGENQIHYALNRVGRWNYLNS